MITISWAAVIVILLVWAFAVMISHISGVERYKDILHAPRYPITQGMSEKELDKLRAYLEECMKDRSEEDKKKFYYYLNKTKTNRHQPAEPAVLIRLIHMLGGELVARQKDRTDIEVEENQGDAYWNYYIQLEEKRTKLAEKHFK